MRQTYRIIEKVATGGMAEVYLARAVAMKGFEKEVAIKRVLPSLTRNRRFVSMFLDEARLSMLLNHPNIIQVFDVGRSGGTYFLVMEYVPGLDLKSLTELLLSKGRTLALPLAVFIIMEVMKALAYAHDLKNEKGEHVMRVHRDVSPPNMLLSRDGHVKLTDFGLAKAAEQILDTDPGVVKGKFSYLSPEAAAGAQVDHRADIFSAGITLWESLANRRLFMGKTDAETVDLVRECAIPPLEPLNPEVDAAFDALIGKALARDPNDRFATAREFGEALLEYLFERGLKVTNFDLGALMEELALEGAGNDGDDPVLALLKGEVARGAAEDEGLAEGWGDKALDTNVLELSGGVHLVDDLFEEHEGTAKPGEAPSASEEEGNTPSSQAPLSAKSGEVPAEAETPAAIEEAAEAGKPAAAPPAHAAENGAKAVEAEPGLMDEDAFLTAFDDKEAGATTQAEEAGAADPELMDENAFLEAFDDDEAAEVMRALDEQMDGDPAALIPIEPASEKSDDPAPEVSEKSGGTLPQEANAPAAPSEDDAGYWDEEPDVIDFGDVPPPSTVYVSPVLLVLLAAMGGMAAVSLAYILIFQLRVFG